jgi:phosphoenolpyruvate-protein kinase (PTS system EI component)
MGLRELSMTATCVPRVKALIRNIPSTQCEILAERVLEACTVADIRKTVDELLAGYLHGSCISEPAAVAG